MKKIPLSSRNPIGLALAVTCIAGATALGFYVLGKDEAYPSSDTGTVDAEVVHIASTVGGRLKTLNVHVNQAVKKGDVLYQLDPEPYTLALQQAQAGLALTQAGVEQQQRLIAVEAANADIAKNQAVRAQTNHELAARTVERLRPLASKSYIPWQQYDQAQVALHDSGITLDQSHLQAGAAKVAVGDLNSSMAARQVAEATLAQARYALRQTTVTAPADGYVASLRVIPGEVLIPSQVLFTLIANDSWFVTANMREGTLHAIHPGDCATVYSMIDRRTPIRGHVESIGWGVFSVDSAGLSRSLPIIPREMDWVHVAQRFPVRIRLEQANPQLLRLGATATVEIRHGPACE
ncbi:multidrug transporter subunit MdtN [Acetobacter syzygii]|uniref:Multidrug transporter subunit MdtN n=1 Tax=Acetobacter syzygii TaxID=146476 RepID=A0A270BWY6_9PROT|nr:multidrug transporter subunit MdtN [Acetobacter syzygii]PAL24355.1 multidrug transporter subunit MdtN [Acetobacter syzygii]PAL29171.1 multidrug transporter subunit MdtN [Acetobacter syzygii]GAN69965.1 multidrug resistance efflux pump HlyD [Acetobacter syzygii]GBR64793.1 multidrug resistance protein MdtN [Acetobacter syzygii NRIC 0483]GEL56682.1 multidrug resistance protein MdtN [Acetobacter syzygii]